MSFAFKWMQQKLQKPYFNFIRIDYIQCMTQKPVEFLVLVQSYLAYFIQSVFIIQPYIITLASR
jgi:hypothetical protein